MIGVRVSIVAAVAANGVIGAGGRLPWRLASDLKRFRSLTMGKPVIMGRRTYESIGRPLEGRTNIVVTRQEAFHATGITVVPSLREALRVAQEVAVAEGGSEIMVIGGGDIYAAVLALADRLYITHVDSAPDGDARFPAIESGLWRPTMTERLPAGEKDSAATTFVVYERLKPRHDPG